MAHSDTRLANRILAGLALGAVAGAATLALAGPFPGLLAGAQWLATHVFDPLGQVFLRLLFFVIMPLIFSSLTIGVLQLGDIGKLGPLAARTFALFFLNMSIAVVLGLVMMNVVQPGNAIDAPTKQRLVEQYSGAAGKAIERSGEMPAMTPMTVVDMFMPRNLIGAIAGSERGLIGEVLPLILFGILVGAVGMRLAPARHAALQSTLETVAELMTGIVHLALRLAPYAVPAMIYSVVVKVGWDILVALGVFVVGCLLVMLVHLFGTMSLWLKLFTRFGPVEFWRTIRPVLVTAFSTSSSNATLPTALAAAREDLDIAPSIAGFVLPLGTTMNMAGTALYEGCVVLFVAQVFGVDLSVSQQITLTLLAVLSAVAVAGVPGASLPLIAGLLVSFNIPAEGIGIIIGVDRILDMARTMVNVGADMVTTTVVDALSSGRTRSASSSS